MPNEMPIQRTIVDTILLERLITAPVDSNLQPLSTDRDKRLYTSPSGYTLRR